MRGRWSKPFLSMLRKAFRGCLSPSAVMAILPLCTNTGVLAQAPETDSDGAQAVVNQYCLECHNIEDWAGSLALDTFDTNRPEVDPDIWEHVIRKVDAGLMPPANASRPSRASLETFTDHLAGKIDAAAELNPGAENLHRLNQAEYRNTVRDLLGLDIDVSGLLPQDDASEGFDNIADVLSVSPTLIESYISAAMKISRLAVGYMDMPPSLASYRVPGDLPQNRHIEGLPLGTRGGMRVEHFFPLDAEYEIQVSGGVGGFRRNSTYPEPEIHMTLDGEEIALSSENSISIPVSAGQHTVTVALLDQVNARGADSTYTFSSTEGAIRSLTINGPINAISKGSTRSREKIFICHPATDAETEACAGDILANLASLAYRLPLTAEGPEVETLMSFFRTGLEQRDFEYGIQLALARILVDPQFIFRMEEEPAGLVPGEVYSLSGLEMASRLSFFLWSSIPDRELLQAATTGKLDNEAGLREQVQRMLADPRADALVENFAGQWLRLRELDAVVPESDDFDEALRRAFREETSLLFASIMRGNNSVLEFLDADYTFVNERLARHYDIEGIHGDFMRRVALPDDSPRRGILGHGSILTVTSVANRTSPVVRGNWLLENILGVPAPVPPAGVETNLDMPDVEAASLTLRQRLELHRADPGCASCHSLMDPLGLALENFDLVGKWREFDEGHRINPEGTLVDGTPIEGPGDLQAALLSRSERFVTTFTEKLLSYAIGRITHAEDMPAIRKIVSDAAETDYRFASIVEGIVLSAPFRMKVKTENQESALSEQLAMDNTDQSEVRQ